MIYEDGKVGSVEYSMPEAMAANLMSTRKGSDKKLDKQAFLVKYVNEECGLLYHCTKVVTTL